MHFPMHRHWLKRTVLKSIQFRFQSRSIFPSVVVTWLDNEYLLEIFLTVVKLELFLKSFFSCKDHIEQVLPIQQVPGKLFFPQFCPSLAKTLASTKDYLDEGSSYTAYRRTKITNHINTVILSRRSK